jgi:hypothetical protein
LNAGCAWVRQGSQRRILRHICLTTRFRQSFAPQRRYPHSETSLRWTRSCLLAFSQPSRFNAWVRLRCHFTKYTKLAVAAPLHTCLASCFPASVPEDPARAVSTLKCNSWRRIEGVVAVVRDRAALTWKRDRPLPLPSAARTARGAGPRSRVIVDGCLAPSSGFRIFPLAKWI